MRERPNAPFVASSDILVLLGLCFALFYWHLGLVPFYTRGESREGLVIWEMVRTGDWILPRINGDYIPYKPPLFHWVGAVLGHLTGRVDELTTRLPSALFATCGVLLIYFAGARFWNRRAGLVSGFVLATATEWWNSAVIAQVDMTLAFFVTAALLCFYWGYRQGRARLADGALLGTLVGCATLAKGPVGILLPGVVITVFLVLRRDIRFLNPSYLGATALLFTLVAGSWYFAAWREGGWAFFQRQIIEENFGTARGSYGHYQAGLYYIEVYLLNFLPWSCFLPAVGWFVLRERHRLFVSNLLFPLVWFGCVFFFFSAANGKRGVYILPLYPAAALMFGAWYADLEQRTIRDWLGTIGGVTVATAALIAVSAGFVTFLVPTPMRPVALSRLRGFVQSMAPLSPVSWACAAIVGISALVVYVFLKQKRWQPVFLAVGLMTAATAVFLEVGYYPAFAAQRTLKPFIARVTRRVGPDAPLFFYDLFDFGAVFYSRRHIPFYPAAGRFSAPVYVLMSEEDWQRLTALKPIERLDISEGGGPTGRHRVVLAEPYGSSSENGLPVSSGATPDVDLGTD